jgi:hypothetical protein
MQNGKQVTYCDAWLATHKIYHPVMGTAKIKVRQQFISFISEVTIGKKQ